ncbi:MAG: non-ribosomal peptide synthetase [Fluviicola sp.]
MKTFFQKTRQIACIQPDKVSFKLVQGEATQDFSYREIEVLVDQKRVILGQIASEGPMLLLHGNPIEFITSFLACQSLGIICVPMFYPRNKRHFERLKLIIEDANCQFALADLDSVEFIQSQLNKNDSFIEVIDLNQKSEENVACEVFKTNSISFIQYTSGSTGAPKGVIISQENLLFNQEMIKNLFGCDSSSTILSWLPIYHDMGLIGNVLHSLYVGSTCVLMSPLDVIQKPSLWLKAISKYKVTHSGGPNFIYDACTLRMSDAELETLDLSSWRAAYNGSEPIKSETIERFLSRFESCGFARKSFYTCYGLAEATLLVSGGVYENREDGEVSSGKICEGVEVVIMDSESGLLRQNGSGEILLCGKAISEGYWNTNSSDFFVEINGKNYLRTGDSGRIEEGELLITGRLKELIIINGKNYYPYDIENELSRSIRSIEPNGVIISYVNANNLEVPIVFSEVQRDVLSNLNPDKIIAEIDRIIVDLLGVEADDILLFTPHKLSRTSSGKLQRVKTKEMYQCNELDPISSKKATNKNKEPIETNLLVKQILEDGKLELVNDFLIELLNTKLKLDLHSGHHNQKFIELGIDSLKSVDLVNTINQTFAINIQVTTLLNVTTLSELEEIVKNLLWMKEPNNTDERTIVL